MPTSPPRTRARQVAARGVAAAIAAALLLSGCGDDSDPADDGSTSTTAAEPTSTTAAPSTTEPAQDAQPVGVYFVRGEDVAVARGSAQPPEVARGALEALLAGPQEGAADMTTEIPNGTELIDLSVQDGRAVVDLSGAFVDGGGSLSMQLRAAQVVFTLTQFDTVDSVTFRIDGAEVDGLGGEGVPATDVDRSDFSEVTPLILVTSPLPGESVEGGGVEVAGVSNTFEANVLYEVTGPDGAVLDEGFTTATAGNGTWGDFSFQASWDGAVSGTATLVVYAEDMESGGRRDVYEVPLQLGG